MRWSDMVSGVKAQVRRQFLLIFQAGGAGSNPVGSTAFALVSAVLVDPLPDQPRAGRRSCHMTTLVGERGRQFVRLRARLPVVTLRMIGVQVSAEPAHQSRAVHTVLLFLLGPGGNCTLACVRCDMGAAVSSRWSSRRFARMSALRFPRVRPPGWGAPTGQSQRLSTLLQFGPGGST